MKAVIVAAGFSTRLYPLTEHFPKGLLEINHKAITGYVVDNLVQLSPQLETVLVTNHRYFDHFQSWVTKHYPHAPIEVIDDGTQHPDERLGAIGDLEFVIEQKGWQDEDLLVLASDTLTTLNLTEFIAFFHQHRGVINAVFDTKDKEVIREKLGCVILDGDNIIEFQEKPAEPKSTITSVPFYIFPKEASVLIGEYKAQGHSTDAPGSIIAWLIGKVPVYAFMTRGYYHDVGTKEVYDKLSTKFTQYS
jgi:glucose-1-phosphate thymidylyltransferase